MSRGLADLLNGIARKTRDAVRTLQELARDLSRGFCRQVMDGVPLTYDEDVRAAICADGGKAAPGADAPAGGKGEDG